jgi:predicted dehydrogenase
MGNNTFGRGPTSSHPQDLYLPLKVAVIGYGQFGRLHARKYQSMAGTALASIVENNPERRELAATENPGTTIYESVDKLLRSNPPQIASVVVPAEQHYEAALQLLGAGVHTLVEKPLASRLHQARTLAELAAKNGLVLQPGHLERFNHTLAELRARLPEWHYLEARRMTRWSARATDVDVVMDLMLHDIDMLLELTDAPIVDIQARGV